MKRYRIYLETSAWLCSGPPVLATYPSSLIASVAAVRRLAHEAADSGLLSPELVDRQITPSPPSTLHEVIQQAKQMQPGS